MTSENHPPAAQHTKGPWSVGDTFNCAKGHAVCAGPFVIARVVENRGEHVNGEKRTPFDHGSANAHLIAASPDLLVALKDCVRMLDAVKYSAGLGGKQLSRLDNAKGVIAKAEGK